MHLVRGGRLSTSAEWRLARAVLILAAFLLFAAAVGIWAGYERLTLAGLRDDPVMQSLFFRLRLPRVILAAIIGATLAAVGAALQAVFRNPLAEPLTLGVSGGGALG